MSAHQQFDCAASNLGVLTVELCPDLVGAKDEQVLVEDWLDLDLEFLVTNGAPRVDEPSEVLVATGTDRGLFITPMLAAGYDVIAINPMSTARYRERHTTSGAKSDAADAATLAEVARLDGHHHRLLEPDSAVADAIKHTARAHQNLVWARQRQLNQLRSVLREFFPAALAKFPELARTDCLATLSIAPNPAAAGTLTPSRIASALRRGGRKRGADAKARVIRDQLRVETLRAPAELEAAMGSHVEAIVAIAATLSQQLERLETNSTSCSTSTAMESSFSRSLASARNSLRACSASSATHQTDLPMDLRFRRRLNSRCDSPSRTRRSCWVVASDWKLSPLDHPEATGSKLRSRDAGIGHQKGLSWLHMVGTGKYREIRAFEACEFKG